MWVKSDLFIKNITSVKITKPIICEVRAHINGQFVRFTKEEFEDFKRRLNEKAN